MSKMKKFAERISIEMGYDGKLNEAVLQEANRILKNWGLERHVLEMQSESKEITREI